MTPTDDGSCRGRGGGARTLLLQTALLVPGLEEIRLHRPLLPPLLLILLLSLTAVVSLRPHLADALAGPDLGPAARGIETWLWLAALFSPVLMGGKALALAVACWSLLALLGRDVRLRPLLSIHLYGEAVLALHGVAAALVLHLRGRGVVSAPEELYVPMGLEGLVPSGSAVLAAVARGATAFHVLWFLFLAVALTRVVDVPSKIGALAAGVSWLLVLAVTAVRAMALG